MRLLKALVVGMGVLIAAGLAAVAVAIVGRLGGGPAPGEGFGAARVAIPPGARIVETATGDGRLLLRLRLADGSARILVIDLAAGKPSGSVDIVEAPD